MDRLKLHFRYAAALIMMVLFSSRLLAEGNSPFMIAPRQANALGGKDFAAAVEFLDLAAREGAIYSEIRRGNIPNYLRRGVTITKLMELDSQLYEVSIDVLPDYLSIGSDADHFLMPMTPMLAQRIADDLGGVLPTRIMVDMIWEAAEVKLEPDPIPPSPEMVSIAVFRDHDNKVQNARKKRLKDHPLGDLVSGTKKDIILTNRIAEKPSKVFIYGWHHQDGKPIQPAYGGHVNWYADYSHGIRIVAETARVNGQTMKITEILKDPQLFQLLSDEDKPMTVTRYDSSPENYPGPKTR